MFRIPVRALVLGVGAALALAYAVHVHAPRTYVASARVLLAEGGGKSRIVKLEHAALDPADAQSRLHSALRSYSGKDVIDPPTLVAGSRSLPLDLGVGALLGLGLGAAATAWRARRRRPVRGEREVMPLLGNPLLGARPLQPEGVRALARQLQKHWFTNARKLLPIVSPSSGDGRSTLARDLALEFAAMGERTLLIDADFRAPSLHRAFSLQNKVGLADLLDHGDIQLAACRENLAVLVAGDVRQDPLELLSRPRLIHFLQAAARPFSVVLIDTPAAERGPDYELFAALAGGALLVVRPGEDAGRISALRKRLTHCAARPVATVFNR
jgi:Mrp family chromosome partitioning ATPase